MTTSSADTSASAPPVLSYDARADAFGRVVDTVAAASAWSAESACEGWTAQELVAHLIDTQRDFLGRHDLDIGARPDLDADPAAAWHAHDSAVRALLADPAVAGHEFDGFFGTTTVGETLTGFYGFDLLVHRWDLARAAGVDERFSDAELSAVEASLPGFGEHLYDEGVCAPAIEVGDGADRQTRLLATLGRRPRSHA